MVSVYSLNKSIKKISFKTKERYDKTKLKNIINCEDVREDDQKVCMEIKKKLGRNVYLDVCYCVPDSQFSIEDYIGRLYSDGNNYQKINKEIRNYLACDLYNDYDIKNCHPVILCELCKRYNIDVKHVFKLKERDELAKKFDISIEELKAEFKFVCNKESHRSKYVELRDIHDEIYKVIVPVFKEKFPEIWDWVPRDKKYNRNASFLCLVFNYFETQIVENYIQFFKDNKISVDVIIHDGFFIDKKKDVGVGMLAEADEYVYKKLDMNVNLVNKPMISKYQSMNFDTGFIDGDISIDDKYAGERLIEMSDGEIIWCHTTQSLWHFNKNIGIWSNDLNGLESKITVEYAEKLKFKQLDLRNNVKEYNYGGDVVKRRKMLEMAKSLAPKHKHFIEDNINHSVIIFKDGVYFTLTNTFVKGFNKNVVHIYNLGYDFSYTYNEEFSRLLKRIFCEDPFTQEQLDEGVGNYLLCILKKAFQGKYDKVYYSLQGVSNGGKGLLYEALKKCLESYIGVISADHLLIKGNEDPEKNLSFVCRSNNKKVVFGNEPTIDKKRSWNAPLLNTLTGGDDIVARELFKNIPENGVKYRPQIFISCNQSMKFSGDIGALKTRARYIEYKVKFVKEGNLTNPEVQKLENANLKDEIINHPDFKLAFFWMIMNAEEVPVPECVKDYSSEILDQSNDISSFIDKTYIFTKDFNDTIAVSLINENCPENIDKITLRQELLQRGASECNKNGKAYKKKNGKNAKSLFCIKLAPENADG
jgi:hypothetical protein